MVLFFVFYFILNVLLFDKRNYFSSSNSIIYFNFIYVIPFVFLYILKGEKIMSPITLFNLSGSSNSTILYYLQLQIIALIFFVFSAKLISFKSKYVFFDYKKQLKISRIIGNRLVLIYYFLTGIGVLLCLYYYQSLGGIVYYLSNLARRSTITQGSGAVSSVFKFVFYFNTVFGVFLMYSKVISNRKFISVFIVTIIMVLLSGSRSEIMRLFFLFIISLYLIYKPNMRSFFSRKNKMRLAVICSILFCYVLVVPAIRASSIEGEFSFDKSVASALTQFENIAKGNAYSEIQLNILNLFEDNDYWMGSSYLDLFQLPFPRSIFPNKPSADDGLYIYNIASSNYSVSGVLEIDFNKLIIQSWPPSSFGMLYANFGIIGIILGYSVLGVLLSLVYNKIYGYRNNLYWIFLYSYMFWRLQFSNLQIFEIIIIVIYTSFIFIIFPVFKKVSYENTY